VTTFKYLILVQEYNEAINILEQYKNKYDEFIHVYIVLMESKLLFDSENILANY